MRKAQKAWKMRKSHTKSIKLWEIEKNAKQQELRIKFAYLACCQYFEEGSFHVLASNLEKSQCWRVVILTICCSIARKPLFHNVLRSIICRIIMDLIINFKTIKHLLCYIDANQCMALEFNFDKLGIWCSLCWFWLFWKSTMYYLIPNHLERSKTKRAKWANYMVFENHRKSLIELLNITSEESYVYILSGQKLIEKAKNGPFWRVFENLKPAVKQSYQTGQF